MKQRMGHFLRHLQQVCAQGTPRRTLLAEAAVVVRFTMGPRGSEVDVLAGQPDGDIEEKWFLNGMMYFKPYRPTFMAVDPVEDLPEVAPDAARLYVRSRGEFATSYIALQEVLLSDVVATRWYELESTQRPVAAFAPHTVPVLALRGWRSAVQVWPKTRGGAARGGDGAEAGGGAREGEYVGEEASAEVPDEPDAEDPTAALQEDAQLLLDRYEIAAHWKRLGRSAPEVELVEDSPEIRAALESLAAKDDAPDVAYDRRELGRLVRLTLDHLPVRYGNALDMKYIHGLPVREMAVRLDMTPKAVESLLTRARQAFRDGFAAVLEGSAP